MVFLINFRWTAGALLWYIWKILFQNAIDPLSDRIGCYLKCMSQHFSWFNSFPVWICAWHNEVFSIRVDLFWGKKLWLRCFGMNDPLHRKSTDLYSNPCVCILSHRHPLFSETLCRLDYCFLCANVLVPFFFFIYKKAYSQLQQQIHQP